MRDPTGKRDHISESQFPDESFYHPVLLRLTDDEDPDLPFFPYRCNRLQKIAESLHGGVCAAGDQDPIMSPLDALQRIEMIGIDAVRNHTESLRGNPECSADVSLHGQERIPATYLQSSQEGSRGADLRFPIHRDRVVNGAHCRESHPGDTEKAIRKALVVMNDIVFLFSFAQIFPGPDSERKRLGKASCAHTDEFKLVDRCSELTNMCHLEQMVGIIEIQTRQLVQRYSIRQCRIGRPGYHINSMPKAFERLAQVFDINSLAAAGRIPAVSQKTNLQ